MDIRTAINLIETNFQNSVVEEVVADIVKDMLDNEFELEAAIELYGRETDEDTSHLGDPKSASSDDRFLSWLHDHVVERVRDAQAEIDWCAKGGMIVGYRMITAPKNYRYDGTRHPGIYWSWDINAPDTHWGDFSPGMVKWLFTAKLPLTSIDWRATLYMSASPDYDSEKEVRLIDNAPVDVISCKRVPGG